MMGVGVRLDGWGSVKASEYRRGDENRPQRWILATSRVNGTAAPGSLSEGAAEAKLRLRECSSMNVSTQKFQSLYALVGNRWHGVTIGGHSLSHARWACQLPQGGSRERLRGCVPFNEVLAKPWGYGRFSSPLRRAGSIHRAARKTEGCGRFSSPLRRAGSIHRAARELQRGGGFSLPEGSGNFTFYHLLGVLPRVNWYFIISVWRSRCMTPSAILRMSRDATKAMVFSASSRGTL